MTLDITTLFTFEIADVNLHRNHLKFSKKNIFLRLDISHLFF